jgi:CarD family transcriptional regulator
LRKLSEPAVANQALEILSGKARSKRGMWNRRAADYQERMGSGQLTAVAEILRDLNRGPQQEEASYSERQIFEGALDFMTKEIAAVRQIMETEARKLIEQGLASALRSSKPAGSEVAA